MKAKIHPKYYPNATVICACGNAWQTGSTKEELRTDICSKCHPFFTGQQRIVDTGGKVEPLRTVLSALHSLKPRLKKSRLPEERRARAWLKSLTQTRLLNRSRVYPATRNSASPLIK